MEQQNLYNIEGMRRHTRLLHDINGYHVKTANQIMLFHVFIVSPHRNWFLVYK